jgi:hypothetical protein
VYAESGHRRAARPKRDGEILGLDPVAQPSDALAGTGTCGHTLVHRGAVDLGQERLVAR